MLAFRTPLLLGVWLVLVGSTPADAQPAARTDRYDDPLPPGAIARVGTVRLRHPGTGSLAFSPNGAVLASAGIDDSIRLWDVGTGKDLHRLAQKSVSCVLFTPDGKTLATGNTDSSVRLWEVSTGRERHCLLGHRDVIRQIAFSPDGRMLASASGDTTALIWDVGSVGHNSGLPNSPYSPADNSAAKRASKFSRARGHDSPLLVSNVGRQFSLYDAAGGRLQAAGGPTTGLPGPLASASRAHARPPGTSPPAAQRRTARA